MSERLREKEFKGKKTGMRNRRKERGIPRILMNVAEIVLLVFLVGFLVWIFRRDTSRDVDMSEISAAITTQCELGELQEGDANTLKRNFNLDVSEYEDYVVYTSDEIMDVDELLIVKVSDSGQLTTLEAAVNERVEEQTNNFEGYGTNQTELLNHAIITEQGDYFFYAVSENAVQWEEVFLSVIR